MRVEEEQHARRHATLEVLEEGSVVTGTGEEPHRLWRFCRSGRHRRAAACQRHVLRAHYSSFRALAEGDEITVKVLKFDRDKERISLGVKQLNPDPWETVEERYPFGSRVIGRVVSITDYGAFVELEPAWKG